MQKKNAFLDIKRHFIIYLNLIIMAIPSKILTIPTAITIISITSEVVKELSFGLDEALEVETAGVEVVDEDEVTLLLSEKTPEEELLLEEFSIDVFISTAKVVIFIKQNNKIINKTMCLNLFICNLDPFIRYIYYIINQYFLSTF